MESAGETGHTESFEGIPMRAAAWVPAARSALVVGAAEYEDPGLRPLRSLGRDAADLAQALSDPQVGGFAVTILLDKSAKHVRRAVSGFMASLAESETVLVYLACHGIVAGGGLFYAMADTSGNLLEETALESSWLVGLLDQCPARQRILILDCCFSEAPGGRKKPGRREGLDLQRELAGTGRGKVVLTASDTLGETGEERPPRSPAIPSLFTAGLVQGLKTGEADTDLDGQISVDDAYSYACTYIEQRGARKEGDALQVPRLWRYGNEAPAVLARNPAGVIVPVPLPEAITGGLVNPEPDIRAGAVKALGRLLTGADPALAKVAGRELERIARSETETPQVTATAEELLDPATSGGPDRPGTPGTHGQPRRLWRLPGRRITMIAVVATVAAAGAVLFAARYLPSRTSPPAKWSLATTLACPSSEGIQSVAFSPDGKNIATGDWNGGACLWDASSHVLSGTLADSSAKVLGAVAFSPDSGTIATADANRTFLWNASSHRLVATLTDPLGGHGDGHSVAFSPDGKTIAVGNDGGVIDLWGLSSHALIVSLTDPAQVIVESVAFSPDGKTVADGDTDSVYLWNASGHTLTATLTVPPGPSRSEGVNSVAFSPDGQTIAASDWNGRTYLWNASTHALLATLTEPPGQDTQSVAFSPDGKLIAVGSYTSEGPPGGRTYLWNASTHALVATLADPSGQGVNSVAFSPDGQTIVTGDENDNAYLWQLSG